MSISLKSQDRNKCPIIVSVKREVSMLVYCLSFLRHNENVYELCYDSDGVFILAGIAVSELKIQKANCSVNERVYW